MLCTAGAAVAWAGSEAASRVEVQPALAPGNIDPEKEAVHGAASQRASAISGCAVQSCLHGAALAASFLVLECPCRETAAHTLLLGAVV